MVLDGMKNVEEKRGQGSVTQDHAVGAENDIVVDTGHVTGPVHGQGHLVQEVGGGDRQNGTNQKDFRSQSCRRSTTEKSPA